MKAHGKAKPFGLELDELFALVAYAYDHPPAPPSANFWALLGSLVRERQLQEAGLFLRYFKQAVEKRMQRQPEATFLYCALQVEHTFWICLNGDQTYTIISALLGCIPT